MSTFDFFTFKGRYYCQKDGVAMGSPVSAVVANIFMQSFEKKALSTAGKLTPRVWKRYVDDVFSIIRKASVDGFLRHINGTDEQINFTIKREDGGKLPFLDVLVRRSQGRTLSTSVYRKPSNTDRLL